MSSVDVHKFVRKSSFVVRNLEKAQEVIEQLKNINGSKIEEPMFMAFVPEDYVKKEPDADDAGDNACGETLRLEWPTELNHTTTPSNHQQCKDTSSSDNVENLSDNEDKELKNDEQRKCKKNILDTIEQLYRLNLKRVEVDTSLRLREEGEMDYGYFVDILDFKLHIHEPTKNPSLLIHVMIDDDNGYLSRYDTANNIMHECRRHIQLYHKNEQSQIIKGYNTIDRLVYVNQEGKKKRLGDLLTHDICSGKKRLQFNKSWICHSDRDVLPTPIKRKSPADGPARDRRINKSPASHKNDTNAKTVSTTNDRHEDGTTDDASDMVNDQQVENQPPAKRPRIDGTDTIHQSA